MVAISEARTGRTGESYVIDLAFPPEGERPEFTRADVVFSGVDHAQSSFEVRLFFNNPTADSSTERTEANGYAGRFHVLGHGGCYGDVGHCDVPERSADATDLRPAHPLTPLDTYVTVTDALNRLLEAGQPLTTLTLVPISVTPRRRDRQPALELLKVRDVSLELYLD
jgi:tyrosinase